MRNAIIAIIAIITPAGAQSLLEAPRSYVPVTVPLQAQDGTQIGTATISEDGRKMYLRDLTGKFIGTLVTDRRSELKVFYDPHGEVTDQTVLFGAPKQ